MVTRENFIQPMGFWLTGMLQYRPDISLHTVIDNVAVNMTARLLVYDDSTRSTCWSALLFSTCISRA